MKKFSASLLAISFFMLILCGCDISKKVQPVKEFSAKVHITCADTESDANVVLSQGNNLLIEITSPESLRGLTYQYANSTLYIEYEKLKCNSNSDYLQKDNPFDAIKTALFTMKTTPVECRKTENDIDVYVLNTERGKSHVYVDSKTGYIRRIKPNYTACEIEFSDIKA
ncbi:MAG: hypothetical protein IKB73_05095 [Ruminococcus sp.]|nr:hypothetical protein [Ruminococcus sp.]